jgi:hypothetical protein
MVAVYKLMPYSIKFTAHIGVSVNYAFDICGQDDICGTGHGLRTPNEVFFHQNPELLGLGRQIGQINSGAFGVFSAKESGPILVQ